MQIVAPLVMANAFHVTKYCAMFMPTRDANGMLMHAQFYEYSILSQWHLQCWVIGHNRRQQQLIKGPTMREEHNKYGTMTGCEPAVDELTEHGHTSN
jgi:hypothetical protein